jgi:carboxylesterase type B
MSGIYEDGVGDPAATPTAALQPEGDAVELVVPEYTAAPAGAEPPEGFPSADQPRGPRLAIAGRSLTIADAVGLSIVGLLAALLVVVAALSFSGSAAPEVSAPVPYVLEPVEATVAQGVLRGRVRPGTTPVAEFKGVPFAAPPTGAARWRPPQPAPAWEGVRDAGHFEHNCIQDPNMYMGWAQPASTQSEDCLYLNIYAPAATLAEPTAKLPVMLWIFGGGFKGGGGNETRLNGTWDVALTEGKLVVVTFSYRLGIFGFLASAELAARDPTGGTGGYGILDQRAAMRWVHENVAAFGGDPQRVLIVGQSAGADSVSQHLVRPASWRYFSAAGLLSGAFYEGAHATTVASQEPSYRAVLDNLSCADAACLEAASTADVLAANAAVTDRHGTVHARFGPTVDGADLTANGVVLAAAGKLAPVPIFVGSTREDLGFARFGAQLPPLPAGRPAPAPAPKCPSAVLDTGDGLSCSETDFSAWGTSMGFEGEILQQFVDVYRDEAGLENGSPPTPAGATSWYWAIKQAGADAWGTCPARRLARWAQAAGQRAYWYYWTYIPDGPNGGTAHHACEQPFVFHVLDESAAELAEDAGHYHINRASALEVDFSHAIVGLYASMADVGDPNGSPYSTAPWPYYPTVWPTYDQQSSRAALLFDGQRSPASADQLRAAKCDFWDDRFLEAAGAAAGTG